MACETAERTRRELQEALAAQPHPRTAPRRHEFTRITALSIRLLAQWARCALQRRPRA